MKKLNLLITVMIFSLCIVSCQKTIDTPDNRSALLADKKWKVTALVISNTTGTVNIYDNIIPCEVDDVQIFSANGKYITDNGIIKCDANDPQFREPGTWEIKGNILTLHEDGTSEPSNATILELNLKTFKMSIVHPILGTLIYTFTAQ